MDSRIPFFCECAAAGCRAMVLLAISEYAAIRAHEARFLTVPGHQAAMAGAAVVERNSRYVVVEEPRASAPAHRRD